MRIVRIATITLVAATTVTGCVTSRTFKRTVTAQQAALDSERHERMAADSSYAAELGAVRADVASLRTDLQNLRTEFGAKITAMEGAVKVTFPINFAFDDATVNPDGAAAVQRLAQVAQKHFTGSVITVEGFADPAGSQSYNLDLSRRRADNVRAELLANGLNSENVRAVGYGKTRLVNPGAERDEPGAEANRRVVFVIETKGTDSQMTASASSPTVQ
ncbi:MAG: OmpA family protein [Gemmatimonadaceae bacterium]|nr:OmpA family protein [Gemmatimonadaceae bacterium]NUQ92368.1 OmpA family protein [Gemmatimonadaceae bacterium]NUR20367.1 OmpA family protein [Gemmatimonadaceae bacterium]NUS97015.1 OmpA family protein [Gemmatimonadaceae bacterium]